MFALCSWEPFPCKTFLSSRYSYHHKLQSTVCETCSASLATTLNMIIRGCVTTQHLSLLRNVPQITHGKQIGNRNQSYWKNIVHGVKQTVKSFKFSLWKIIKYCPCSVRRECFSSSPQVLVIALFLCTDYSLSVRTCPLRGWFLQHLKSLLPSQKFIFCYFILNLILWETGFVD